MCAYRTVATPNFLLTHTYIGTMRGAVLGVYRPLSTSEGFVFFWKCYFDRFMTKGYNFDMHLMNHAKYKVNSSYRYANNMHLITAYHTTPEYHVNTTHLHATYSLHVWCLTKQTHVYMYHHLLTQQCMKTCTAASRR